ncbi:hypothetical protein Ac2012v2_005336 [Leucoagaricus gongylophorus]
MDRSTLNAYNVYICTLGSRMVAPYDNHIANAIFICGSKIGNDRKNMLKFAANKQTHGSRSFLVLHPIYIISSEKCRETGHRCQRTQGQILSCFPVSKTFHQ